MTVPLAGTEKNKLPTATTTAYTQREGVTLLPLWKSLSVSPKGSMTQSHLRESEVLERRHIRKRANHGGVPVSATGLSTRSRPRAARAPVFCARQYRC